MITNIGIAGLRREAGVYLSLANINSTQLRKATNRFTEGLLDFGLFNRMTAVYLFLGDNADSTSYNLINPYQYKIDWYDGVEFLGDGITPNGIDGYGNTNLNDNVLPQDDRHFAIYSRSDTSGLISDLGVFNGTNANTSAFLDYLGQGYIRLSEDQTGSTHVANSTEGSFIFTRSSSTNKKGYKYGSEIFNATTSSMTPLSIPHYISAINVAGTPDYFSSRKLQLVSFGLSLDATQVTNYEFLINNFVGEIS